MTPITIGGMPGDGDGISYTDDPSGCILTFQGGCGDAPGGGNPCGPPIIPADCGGGCAPIGAGAVLGGMMFDMSTGSLAAAAIGMAES